MAPPAWNAGLWPARAARPRSARHGANLRDGSLSWCNRAEGTLLDLCRPRQPAARRPRAFGPLCRPEAGVPSRFRRFHDRRGVQEDPIMSVSPGGGLRPARGPQGRRARRAVQNARRTQPRTPPRWSAGRARAAGDDVAERAMSHVEVVPCAALSRSACRRKPAFQAVSAIFVTGGVRRRTHAWAFLPVGVFRPASRGSAKPARWRSTRPTRGPSPPAIGEA